MRCQGVGMMPTNTYENIRNYTLVNGRPWYFSGLAECPACGGAYRTRRVGNYAVLKYHKRFDEVSAKRQKEITNLKDHYRRRGLFMRPRIPTGTVTHPYWGGEIRSLMTMAEVYTMPQTIGVNTFYNAATPFRIELTSETYDPSTRNWLYNVNGHQVAWPESRMCVTTTNAVWNAWTNDITVGSNSAATNFIWNDWMRTTITNTGYNAGGAAALYTPPRPTPQQIEERRAAEYERVQIRERARVEASGRAERTLLELLEIVAPDQIQAYRERRSFEIRGSRGTRYRIRHGSAGNVDALSPTGLVIGTLCAHPLMRDSERNLQLPHEDAMIAQMMNLITDEESWLAVANVHRGRRPQLALT